MTKETKIAFIKATREEVMDAAEAIIRVRMREYADKFGWDKESDAWLWQGIGDCGVGYLIATGNVTNGASEGGD